MKSLSRENSHGSKSLIQNTSFTALPLILLPRRKRQISKAKLKEQIVHLKKELNKTQYEYKELKISMVKLEALKKKNKKVLDSAMNESKIVDRPLDLIRSNSARELSISIDTYENIKESNMIFNIKQDISQCQQKIKEKTKQMRELTCESKYASLIGKNKELIATINKITSLNTTFNDLKIISLEKEIKREDDILNRDYYKVINGTIRNENDSLKEKIKSLSNTRDISRKKLKGYEDKFNNYKLNYNLLKKTEREIDNRIKYNISHTGSNSDVVKLTEEYNREINKNITIIQSIEEEIKFKTKKWEEMNKSNEEVKGQVENEKNSIKRYRLDESIIIDGIKKDIVRTDKDIHCLKSEYIIDQKDLNRLIIKLERKEQKRLQKIQKQIAAYKVCRQSRLSFIRNKDNVEGEEKETNKQLSDNDDKKDKTKGGDENKDNKKKKKKDKEDCNKDKDKGKENNKKASKDKDKDKSKEDSGKKDNKDIKDTNNEKDKKKNNIKTKESKTKK